MTSPKPPDVVRAAIFDPSRRFRYVLVRRFPEVDAPLRLNVWLNPSTADEHTDDASVRVGMSFWRRWGDGGGIIINVGDLVETYSKNLPALHAARLGPDHWRHVLGAIKSAYGRVRADVLCGWGDEGAGAIAEETVALLRGQGLRPVALAVTKRGNPGHPLRKSLELPLVPYETPSEKREAWGRVVKNRRNA